MSEEHPTAPRDDTPPEAPPGMPAWVKVFLIVVVVLAVALVVSRLAGIEHGPGLHGP